MSQLQKNIFFLVIIGFAVFAAVSCSNSDGNQGTNKETKQNTAETVNFALDAFIVNLNTPTRTGFLRASMQLELANAVLAEKAKAKTAHLRDAIVTVLSNKTPDELMSVEGKQQCKDEIILIAEQALGENSVKNVYFTDFVMQ